MRSGNPTLSDDVFLDAGSGELVAGNSNAMTLEGTVNKTAMLLALVVITAAMTWNMGIAHSPAAMGVMIGGALLGFVVALVTVFKKEWAPVTAPLYAVLEGAFIGVVSAFYEQQYPGIVMQAASLTFATLAAMLMAYRSGLIQPTENFKMGVVAATGGICIVYLVSIVLNLFGIQVPFIHDSGPIGIAFSLFVVVIAALNLVMDFDFIETGVNASAPKHLEWYGAFALTVTLVWLYLEFLRLLSKLRD